MDAAIHKYTSLIERFTSGTIDATRFESEYLRIFKNEVSQLPESVFEILDALFADVDAFCPDPALRDSSDLDENGLRARCQEALRELTAAVAG